MLYTSWVVPASCGNDVEFATLYCCACRAPTLNIKKQRYLCGRCVVENTLVFGFRVHYAGDIHASNVRRAFFVHPPVSTIHFNSHVKAIKPYGAFVEIRGMSGLLHISQISFDRIEDLPSIMQLGMKLKCMIIDHDKVRIVIVSCLPAPYREYAAARKCCC